MGLTVGSTGSKSIDTGLNIKRKHDSDLVIALGGNPNVGKSTVFNALTGMKQHTGNWPGKTVTNACGTHSYKGRDFILVDLPGTYSLFAHSAEEEVARDFICFGGADAAVIVCDATCLERNLNLVLQTIEITPHTVVCVNLLDEAKRKGIKIDLAKLEALLGVPVVGTNARKGEGLEELIQAVTKASGLSSPPTPIRYPAAIEEAAEVLCKEIESLDGLTVSPRWASLRIIEGEDFAIKRLTEGRSEEICHAIEHAKAEAITTLERYGYSENTVRDKIAGAAVMRAHDIAAECCSQPEGRKKNHDRTLDRLFMGRGGVVTMLLMLIFIFWLTITGANYPSQLLSEMFAAAGNKLHALLEAAGSPAPLTGALMDGVYRVLTWVVSVMLPPMAIFFPLFTLLEDFGYLPRVAFNLDHSFQKAGACGKQALTMCMGFGCNAAGVTGCRIIDSPRERLIAAVTNNFVPCNGRFPTIISIISMFFLGSIAAPLDSVLSAVLLALLIALAVGITFAVSRLLSKTILKGIPSSFTLELPPYRRPQIGKVIIRSIFDRTLFVLGRAAAVAAPAGLLIWLTANIYIGGESIFAHCAGFLDPAARLFGMDGIIFLAFILGFPANETVLPIILMGYLATGTLTELGSTEVMRELLTANGWTWVTAVCVILFSLFHWPCSTTCITIKKETGSLKWALLSVALPTAVGLAICFIVNQTSNILSLV